ncbi:ABC transporter ATP-binding protein [Thermoproteota archaeon]
MNRYAIECNDIAKQYGHLYALRHLTINIEVGETVGVLGHNGAGKSTFLKILGTHLSPTIGSLKIMNNDIEKSRREIRKIIGYVGHSSFMYDELTVEENLRFYGKMFSINYELLEKKIDEVLDFVDMDRYRFTASRKLSHGLRKRADLARVFLHSPKVMILDEPFSGLDKNAVKLFVNGLKSQSGITIIISSHSFEMLNDICKRTLTFSDGLLVKDSKGD